MSNNSKSVPAVSSVEGAGRVVDGGDVSSEGLGLGGGPVLTLEWLGHGLVGHLASSTVDRGGVDSSVDHRSGNGMSSVDNRGSMDDRAGNSMDNGAGDSDRVGNRDSLGVDSLAIVGDGGDVSINVIGSVRDVLSSAVREGDGVRSSPGSGAVVSLGSLEVGAGVVVGNGVLVLVGGDLVGVHLSDGVGNGVGNNRGVVDDGSGVVDGVGNNGGVVGNGVVGDSVVGNGGSVNEGSVVGNSVVGNGVGHSVVGHGVVGNGDVGGVSEHDVLGGGEELGSGGGRGHEGEESEGLHVTG
jgi:hypothetical protein